MSQIEPSAPDNSIEPTVASEISVTEGSKQPSKAVTIVGRIWNSSILWRVTTLLLIVAVAFQGITTQPLKALYDLTDPYTNGFVEPRDMGAIITKLDESVVTIYCEVSKEDSVLGTAWAFDYQDPALKGRTPLMTNHHVIESCISGGVLSIEDIYGDVYKARIERYDEYNDLAILSTAHKITPLELASYPPSAGYWVMAYGTADGYIGSIAKGNIINIDENGDLLISANISGGNSGGPLVDNEGNVFGVNTWSYNSERDNTQYNISVSLDSFCYALIECDGETYWEWDN